MKWAIPWLKFLCFLVFAGRAWQHLRWDAPYRALLWSESLLLPFFEKMDWQWHYYVTHSDAYISGGIKFIGIFYLLCASAALLASPLRRVPRFLLPTGGFMLFILALLCWKEKYFYFGELIEYSLQIVCPFLLYVLIYRNPKPLNVIRAMQVAIALTFVGHGLYALGYYPVPGNFQQMMVNFFGVNETTARQMLFWAGFIDIVIAIGIFVPRLQIPMLAYAAFWGFVTAFARLVANYDAHIPLYSLNLWLFEVLCRIPNGGLPLLLLFLLLRAWGKPTANSLKQGSQIPA